MSAPLTRVAIDEAMVEAWAEAQSRMDVRKLQAASALGESITDALREVFYIGYLRGLSRGLDLLR